MDKIDTALIAALRRDARQSLSQLSSTLGITRSTVRARLDRLIKNGVIAGFNVVLTTEIAEAPVRGMMMLGIEGRGTDRLIHRLTGMPEVTAVHATNGKWDLMAELATDTLETLDRVLSQIRKLDGVATSETNLFLKTHRAGRPGA